MDSISFIVNVLDKIVGFAKVVAFAVVVFATFFTFKQLTNSKKRHAITVTIAFTFALLCADISSFYTFFTMGWLRAGASVHICEYGIAIIFVYLLIALCKTLSQGTRERIHTVILTSKIKVDKVSPKAVLPSVRSSYLATTPVLLS